ncbi:MAG: phosphatidylserine decarboxylase [Rickettsiales bacterium]|nr:phosphatidylserine decarboxylase [Rickettsiales bacterium]
MSDNLNHLEDIYNSIKNGLTPIHPEGKRFALYAAVGGLALSWFIWDAFAWIGVVLAVYCLYFFRDPERFVPEGENIVVSPGDGLVQMVVEGVTPPTELELGDEPHTRISIFLNVFDVHINRVPIAGKIIAAEYIKGSFLNAELDKASEENERQMLTVENAKCKVGFVQIAGFVARRILCDIKLGDEVETGQRFGLIRFGSRVDVFLPKGAKIKVREGQRSIGAETVLAEL